MLNQIQCIKAFNITIDLNTINNYYRMGAKEHLKFKLTQNINVQ